jgi:hypothetical protein
MRVNISFEYAYINYILLNYERIYMMIERYTNIIIEHLHDD